MSTGISWAMEALSPLDLHFAALLVRRAGGGDDALGLAAALCSQWRERGHVRLDLRRLTPAAVLGRPAESGEALPPVEAWLEALRASPMVGAPGAFRPLILDEDGGLYLQRYWQYEQDIARALRARIGWTEPGMDAATLSTLLGRLFPCGDDDTAHQQRTAAVMALRGRLTVISGGPGTGKTSTVVRILALLLAASGEARPTIALTAPTGKAAARLQESIRSTKGSLDVDRDVVDAIPEATHTLHRLLGARPGSARCRYDEERPLPHDVIVVDEASMVDVALMAKLLKATRPHARIILLGDKDQLASVEAGALLGDICWRAGASDAEDPLRNHIVLLEKNYRFGRDSAIGTLARAIQCGDADAAMNVLSRGAGGVTWQDAPDRARLAARVRDAYAAAFEDVENTSDPAAAVAVLDRLRVLCAVHRGPLGVDTVNASAAQDRPGAVRQAWYPGRPVMVTRNDYAMNLFNGDTGLVIRTPEGLRIAFPSEEATVRLFHPARLPEHTTVYAMSIHRAQGSEFDEVIVVLPDVDSPVLSRELLYTAVTRARTRVEIWARPEILHTAMARPIERAGGLRKLLWGAFA